MPVDLSDDQLSTNLCVSGAEEWVAQVRATTTSSSAANRYQNIHVHSICEYKPTVLAVVSRKGTALRYVSGILRADKQIVLAAVAQDGCAFEHASQQLKADSAFVKEVVAICALPKTLRNSNVPHACAQYRTTTSLRKWGVLKADLILI